MFKLSYIPTKMKRGIIITIFKGGNKIRNDPNNYRAITLSSVLIRLYEAVLLHKLNIDNTIVINPLQDGVQKHLGSLMSSFSLRECIFLW